MRGYTPIAQIESRDPDRAARIRAQDTVKRRRLRAIDPEANRAAGRRQYRARAPLIIEKKLAWRKENRARYMLIKVKQRAKEKGVNFDLTIEWFETRLKAGACELSGLPFDLEAKRGRNSPTIDRITAGGHYTQANCRMILWSINRALNNYGEDYLFGVFERVLARRRGE